MTISGALPTHTGTTPTFSVEVLKDTSLPVTSSVNTSSQTPVHTTSKTSDKKDRFKAALRKITACFCSSEKSKTKHDTQIPMTFVETSPPKTTQAVLPNAQALFPGDRGSVFPDDDPSSVLSVSDARPVSTEERRAVAVVAFKRKVQTSLMITQAVPAKQ